MSTNMQPAGAGTTTQRYLVPAQSHKRRSGTTDQPQLNFFINRESLPEYTPVGLSLERLCLDVERDRSIMSMPGGVCNPRTNRSALGWGLQCLACVCSPASARKSSTSCSRDAESRARRRAALIPAPSSRAGPTCFPCVPQSRAPSFQSGTSLSCV